MEPNDALDLQDLRLSVSLALDIINADDSIIEAEVCTSWCDQMTSWIQYDTDHLDDAIQPPRTLTQTGVGILVIVEDKNGRRSGFSSEADDLSLDAIERVLEDAKRNATTPVTNTFARPEDSATDALDFHDPDVASLPLEELTRLASEALDGALSTLRDAGLVTHFDVQGHICSRTEHMMLGNTHGLMAGETTTGLFTTLMTRLTTEPSRGHSQCNATHLGDFSPYETGVEAANRLLQARDGKTLDSGTYPVIFGPEAVAALIQALLIPALSLDTAAAGASPLAAFAGQSVAADFLTLTDNGRLPRQLGSRRFTGEGLPTGSTLLIDQGHLVGLLADTHQSQAATSSIPLVPRNGMRHQLRHQSFDMRPGIFPTNVVLSSEQALDSDALIASTPDGIYVGGLWDITPQGEPQQGNFTGTLIGPSYQIQDGKRTHPLLPGTMHLEGNIQELLTHITGISSDSQSVALPTMQSTVLSPEVRCRQIRLVS